MGRSHRMMAGAEAERSCLGYNTSDGSIYGDKHI